MRRGTVFLVDFVNIATYFLIVVEGFFAQHRLRLVRRAPAAVEDCARLSISQNQLLLVFVIIGLFVCP